MANCSHFELGCWLHPSTLHKQWVLDVQLLHCWGAGLVHLHLRRYVAAVLRILSRDSYGECRGVHNAHARPALLAIGFFFSKSKMWSGLPRFCLRLYAHSRARRGSCLAGYLSTEPEECSTEACCFLNVLSHAVLCTHCITIHNIKADLHMWLLL